MPAAFKMQMPIGPPFGASPSRSPETTATSPSCSATSPKRTRRNSTQQIACSDIFDESRLQNQFTSCAHRKVTRTRLLSLTPCTIVPALVLGSNCVDVVHTPLPVCMSAPLPDHLDESVRKAPPGSRKLARETFNSVLDTLQKDLFHAEHFEFTLPSFVRGRRPHHS